jgi:[ribosomal protein S5]-alanine N-acetyltransferase
MPIRFASEILTPRLCIRPVEKTDLPALLAVNGDDTVTRYLPYASWKDLADAEAWFERICGYHKNGDTLQCVIVRRDTGDVIGACLLFKVVEASARGEIGYVLGRSHWGKGYASEALSAFIERIFVELSLFRLEAEIDPRNDGSARVLQRLGFLQEGLLRQRWRLKGETTDSALYGLLRPDWLAANPGGE